MRSTIFDIFALFAAVPLGNAPMGDDPDTLRQATAARVAVWEVVMDDLTPEELKAAAAAWLRIPERGRWWPTPADLRALVPRLQQQTAYIEEANADDGSRYWPAVLRAVASMGRDAARRRWAESPSLLRCLGLPEGHPDLPAIIEGIRAADWTTIANSSHDAERARLGRTFCAAYGRCKRGEVRQLIEGPVINLLEVMAARGIQVPAMQARGGGR